MCLCMWMRGRWLYGVDEFGGFTARVIVWIGESVAWLDKSRKERCVIEILWRVMCIDAGA